MPEHPLSKAEFPELDYVYLSNLLKDYARPRQEISRLLKKGELLRVKKGLYVAQSGSKRPYSKEILANLIYGPSYLSLDYALRHYGFIPERVEELTSVTKNRDKSFDTPIGRFSYRYLNRNLFSLGVAQVDSGDGRPVLMASPEKALVDKIYFDARNVSPSDLGPYLFESLRIDPERLKTLRTGRLADLLERYKNPLLEDLLLLVRKTKKEAIHE